MFKNWVLFIVAVLSLSILSCSSKDAKTLKSEQFAGQWDITIKKLPKVGDQLLSATFSMQDTILTGSFIDSENNNITFDKIEIEGNEMVCSYVWDGHNVKFNVEMDPNNPNILKGRFMRLFKVEAVREIN
ncbi:hypothetical protein E9993_15425 [Labilibacter sediminis]|nr:hypothetical protein E9993_15425 [Labilibacter sediminis]